MKDNTPIFEALLDRYAPLVLRLLWQTVGSREKSEELASKAFVSLARQGVDLDSPGLPRQVVRAALRRCNSRRSPAWQWKAPPIDADWALGALDDSGQGPLVLSVVGLLPLSSRCAVYFHYFEDRSPQEIGALMGRSTTQVERDLERGRTLFEGVLRQKLEGENVRIYRAAMAQAPVPSLAWQEHTLQAMEKAPRLPAPLKFLG